MAKGQLKCQVLKGVFSDERTIVLQLWDGDRYSAWVPSSEVTGEIDHEGAVNVDVYRDQEATWAVLPTEYRDMVAVKAEDVVAP